MKILPILWTFFFASFLPQEKPTVEVFNVEKEDRIEIHARNLNDYPITIEVDIELLNLTSSNKLPVKVAISPKSEKLITDLKMIKGSEKWGFSTKYTYHMGSVFAKHNDNFAYRLPYRLGTEAIVAQGYFGDFSHTDAITYSIDFDLEEGTEIYAARSGIVVDTQESFTDGGTDEFYVDKANFITIVHNDGTFSEYSHLKVNGVNVTVGQRVRVGQLIGYSGATGYATGPHLHFSVKKVGEDGHFMTIPVKFSTQEGTVTLQEKKKYKAL